MKKYIFMCFVIMAIVFTGCNGSSNNQQEKSSENIEKNNYVFDDVNNIEKIETINYVGERLSSNNSEYISKVVALLKQLKLERKDDKKDIDADGQMWFRIVQEEDESIEITYASDYLLVNDICYLTQDSDIMSQVEDIIMDFDLVSK